MKKYKLYVKISPLGLKYLGKTEQNNVHEYLSSGDNWTSHIDENKFTFKDIKTDILFESDDKAIFKEKCIHYSKLFNVVQSKQWANIVEEQGSGGNTNGGKKVINKAGKHLMVYDIEYYLNNGWNLGWNEFARKSQSEVKKDLLIGEKNGMYGKNHKKESINLMRINRGDLLLDKNPRSKVVYQYSLDGNFIKSWNCVKIAAIELGIYYDSIIYACNGKRKTAGKYKWKYETK